MLLHLRFAVTAADDAVARNQAFELGYVSVRQRTGREGLVELLEVPACAFLRALVREVVGEVAPPDRRRRRVRR